jgi:DNA-binding MarR family transcriptional regulator
MQLPRDCNMNTSYLDAIQLLPQIHRQFMNVIKADLEGLKVHDINNVQMTFLVIIGDAELSLSELTSLGVYLRSNVSYHVKKMVEAGYLAQKHSLHDRRVSYVRLTEKGSELREEMTMLLQRRIDQLSEVALSSDELHAAASVLRLMDHFLTDVVGRVLGSS